MNNKDKTYLPSCYVYPYILYSDPHLTIYHTTNNPYIHKHKIQLNFIMDIYWICTKELSHFSHCQNMVFRQAVIYIRHHLFLTLMNCLRVQMCSQNLHLLTREFDRFQLFWESSLNRFMQCSTRYPSSHHSTYRSSL